LCQSAVCRIEPVLDQCGRTQSDMQHSSHTGFADSYMTKSYPEWTFYEWRTGPSQRDPIQGEFFATEAIRDPAEALVREGIQNSLDAATNEDGVEQTLVRITVATGKN